MEYEFRRDLTGCIDARFSMDHEALGNWLLTEPAARPERLAPVFKAISELLAGDRWEYFLPGQEFDLKLTRSDAVVRSAALPDDNDGEELMDDDMDFYDQELQAECGLDDFNTMLDAWQEFNDRV